MVGREKYTPYSMQVEVPWHLYARLRWKERFYYLSNQEATGVWVIIETLDG